MDDRDKLIKRLKKDLAEADRRAGAAERENAGLRDTINRNRDWLARAKKEAGYRDSVSFDVVWAETLKLACERKTQIENQNPSSEMER
jgi:hypothetical protein